MSVRHRLILVGKPAANNRQRRWPVSASAMAVLGWIASGSLATLTAQASPLADYGPAAELTGIAQWHNGPALRMADLRGKVVLINFWTYSCINCIRTLPYISQWHAQYQAQGLVAIGVHTPEFAYERDASRVAVAIARLRLLYPVAQDNRYATWHRYENRYWPASYLIDKGGRIRMKHFGEGNYAGTDGAIRQLLADGGPAKEGQDNTASFRSRLKREGSQ